MSGFGRSLAPTRPAVRTLSPFPELVELQKLVSAFPFWGGEQTTHIWSPTVDIFESDTEIVIKMDLPEVKKNEVSVNLDGQTLTIQGERTLENEEKRDQYHRIERSYGKFARSFTVPPNVNREALRAEYVDGVLRLVLPKREEAKPRSIEVE
jgi:HSP20 family protein